MAKETQSAKTIISSEDDFLGFVNSLPAANSNKSRTAVKATVGNISSLNVSKLKDVEETIYLSRTNIEINLKGDVGIYTAALLSRSFRRKGFAGRNINLAIPASVGQSERDLLVERISQCAKTESLTAVKDLILKGSSISMVQAKELGLIDTVIDLSKRRPTKNTTAVVSSDDKTVDENSTATA